MKTQIEAYLIPITTDIVAEVGNHLIVVGEGAGMVCIGVDTGKKHVTANRRDYRDTEQPESLARPQMLASPEKRPLGRPRKDAGTKDAETKDAETMGRPPLPPLLDPNAVLDALRQQGPMTAFALGNALGLPLGDAGHRLRQRLSYALSKLKKQKAIRQTKEMDGQFFKLEVVPPRGSRAQKSAAGAAAAGATLAAEALTAHAPAHHAPAHHAPAHHAPEAPTSDDDLRLVGNARQLIRAAIRRIPAHVALLEGAALSDLSKVDLLGIARALGIDVAALVAQAAADADSDLFHDDDESEAA